MQLRAICKSKIHRATVTEANVDYIGSIAIGTFVWGMIGLGFGPLFVGVMSDPLATGLFTGGDFAVLCPGGSGLTPETVATCKTASATGLQHALIGAASVFYLLATVIYLVAARTVRRDLDR